MKIILNHTLRSIRGSKLQIAVIILTIIVVTAMLFAAISISDLFYNVSVSGQSRLSSDNDITCSGEVFTKARLDEYVAKNSEKISRVEYFLQFGGLLQTAEDSKIIMIEATDLQQLWQNYPQKLKIVSQAKDYHFSAIWIGEDLANELKINTGDIIDIYLQQFETTEKFTVVTVMENSGFFADNLVDNVLVDLKDVNNRGLVNVANIKLADKNTFEQVRAELTEYMQNDALSIDSSIDYERAEQVRNENSRLLNIALTLILVMMFVILYTSYLVVARNRLSEMVIFKAAGATSAQTTLIMLFEVLLYGAFGSAIGLAIGRFGMGIAVKQIIPNFPSAVSYQWWKYLVAFLLGIAVSTLSAIVPILRIGKKSIRELTSGIIKEPRYAKPIFIILATVIIIALTLTVVLLNVYVVALTVVLTVLFAVWIILVAPYLIKFFSMVLSKIRISRMASISIKRNSASHTLSILVGCIITFSFFVYAIISLVIVTITPYNARFSGEFVVTGSSVADYDKLAADIRAINGVGNVYSFESCEFEVGEEFTYDVIGISDSRALSYAAELDEKAMERYDSTANPIIINNDLSLRTGKKIGDTFTVSRSVPTASGVYEETLDVIFTVAGIDYSTTENDRVAYVRAEQLLYDGKKIAADEEKLFVFGDGSRDEEELFLSLRATCDAYKGIYTVKFSNWEYATTKGLEGLATLFRVLQIWVSAVACIGIVNLTVVTIIDRKKEFAIYRASGMDASKYCVLSAFEGFIVGAGGAVIGMVFSFVINRLMSPFARLINKYMTFDVFPLSILAIAGIGLAVYVLIYAAISVANRKMLSEPITYNERL